MERTQTVDGELCAGDPVVVRLPLLGTETERRMARGVVTHVEGDTITVRLVDGAEETSDEAAPSITLPRADVVPAPIAEVP